MRKITVLVAAVFAVMALAGCLGNSVSIAGQGFASGKETKTINCGGTGQIGVGNQGAGNYVVSVFDADNNLIYKSGGFSSGQTASGGSANGIPGTWALEVNFGSGYSGQWGVTLSC